MKTNPLVLNHLFLLSRLNYLPHKRIINYSNVTVVDIYPFTYICKVNLHYIELKLRNKKNKKTK